MSAISRTAGQDENIVRWTVAPLQLAFDMKKRVFLQHLSNAVRTLGMKSAGDSDTNAHPCRIGGADFFAV